MMKALLGVAVCVLATHAQDLRTTELNSVSYQSGTYDGAISLQPRTYFEPADSVFPHFATGGSWDTILVVVNLSDRTMDFTQRFYGTDGKPLPVTFRSIPDGVTQTSAATKGTLSPGGSFNIQLTDNGDLKTGWASLDYDFSLGRIGAYMAFRQRVPGRATAEALVPLSSYLDYSFYMPIDNLEGYATAIAIANPANSPTTVRLVFKDLSGKTIDSTNFSLAALSQTSFVVADRFSAAAGRVGTLYVEGSTNRLSALGFRFNPTGGFSSVPIMNWSGMFN